MKQTFFQLLAILGLSSSLSAHDPFILDMDQYQVPISEDISFADLIYSLDGEIDTSKPFTLALEVVGSQMMIKVAQNNGPRDYYSPVTPQEKGDLSELVKTLANEGLLSLPSKEKHLTRIGDRLVHIHPLKFLGIIFSDNEMKVAIRNLEARTVKWVWKKFQGETVESLAKEHSAGNLKQDQINDFANKVGVKSSEITQYIQGQKWEDLISHLISKTTVDKPQGKKYDM